MKKWIWMAVLIAALVAAAGFFAGRALSKGRCPRTDSDRLKSEIGQVQNRIRRADRKIAEIRRRHPEEMLR